MRTALSIALLILGNHISLFAQTDAKAKSILSEVSKKYQSFTSIKVDFLYTIDNPQAKIKDSQGGTLVALSKSSKYKISLKGQELISDGKVQWTYLKADKEVQINSIDPNSNAFNPAKLFTIYEKGFKCLYNGDSKINGKDYHLIDLVPLEDKHSFFKIRLQINKQTKLITNALIFDKNGNRYTYEIKSFVPNIAVMDSTFTFNVKAHPGVEVVDLR